MVRRAGRQWYHATKLAILAFALVLLAGCTAGSRGAPPGATTSAVAGLPLSEASPSPMAPEDTAPRLPVLPPALPSATAEPPLLTVAPEGVAATGESDADAPGALPASASPTPPPLALPASPTPQATPITASSRPAGPRQRVIALDPGHGGPEVGAGAPGLAEKDVNLKIALKLAGLLRAEGYSVVLTRETDQAVSPEYKGGGYQGGMGKDLQTRIDIANTARADLFISIHNNGHPDPGQSGAEVWYNRERSFADRNVALAKLVLAGLVKQIRGLGYPVVERGIKDDTNFRIFRGRAYNIFVLGPGTGPREHPPTEMPGVLGESLFLSNPGDLAMLRKDTTLDAIAAGYRDAIVAYFEQYPDFDSGLR